MPYKAETIRLPRYLDRRIKLSEEDVTKIKSLHKEGVAIRAIAREFKQVSRRRIQQIVNPEVGRLAKERVKKNWRLYVDRERLNAAARNLRRYKNKLFKKGLITFEK